ncbi:MAG: DUF1631 family protein [Gammaproteobacteria bacterium]
MVSQVPALRTIGEPRRSERRRVPRVAIDLPATIINPNRESYPCTIRDFCAQGMLLAVDQIRAPSQQAGEIRPQDPISVRFSVALSDTSVTYELLARVAWAVGDSLGIAVIGSHKEALAALERIAEKRPIQSPIPDDVVAQSGGASAQARPKRTQVQLIIQELKTLVADPARKICAECLLKAEEHLFEQAKVAGSNVAQSELIDAVSLIHNNRGRLAPALAEVLARKLEALDRSQADVGPSTAIAPLRNANELVLVKQDDFEDFLSLSEAIARVELRYKDVLYRLQRRFSLLSRSEIDRTTNPIGPASLCNLIGDALHNLDFTTRQCQAVYPAVSASLLENLGDLYQRVNECLKKRNVLPNLDGTPATHQSVQRESPLTRDTPVPAGVHDACVTHSDPGGAVGRRVHSAVTPPAGEGTPATPNPSPRNPVGKLLQLRQWMGQDAVGTYPPGSQDPGRQAQGHGGFPVLAGSEPYYNASDLIAALPAVERELTLSAAGAGRSPDVKAGLVAALESRIEAGADRRSIHPDDEYVLDVVSRLTTPIGGDAAATNGNPTWLQRLAVPLHKLALSEPEFLSDPSHPVYRFVNELARLQHALPQSGDHQQRLSGVIEHLAARIDGGDNDSTAPIREALADIQALEAQRVGDYENNVTQVIETCNRQQAFLQSRVVQGIAGKRTEAKTEGVRPDFPKEWLIWLEHAKQFRVGQAFQFRGRHGSGERRYLAWIGENHNLYVFADKEGNKAASLTLHELAMQLRRGAIKLAGSTEVTAIDQALRAATYSVFHDIHHAACHDRSTDLENRQAFIHRLSAAMARSEGVTGLLGYVQLKAPPEANERIDPQRFDEILKQSSTLLQQSLPAPGTLARLDRTSLAWVLPEGDPTQGEAIVHAQHEALSKVSIKRTGALSKLRVHIGAVAFGPHGGTAEEHLNRARSLAEQVDAAGGYKLDLSGWGGISSRREEGIDWETHLDHALSNESIIPYAQRVTALQSAENLAPLYRIVPRFLCAEEVIAVPLEYEASRLAPKVRILEHLLLRESIQWMGAHRNQTAQTGAYVFRLSSDSLNDAGLIEYVLNLLTEHPVPPGKVCFEATEDTVLANAEPVHHFIRTVHEFGCRFSLACLGQNTAKHALLGDLPVDFFAISGTFVSSMTHNLKAHAVVQSAHELGRLFGTKTVAEGAEGEETLTALRNIGVDYAVELTPTALHLSER